MKRMIITFLLLLCTGGISSLLAVNAYPYPVVVTLPDGSSLTVRIHGDEYFNYRTTEDGYVIARGTDGFYYYAGWDASGNMELTQVRAHNAGGRSVAEQAALAMRGKGVPPGVRSKMMVRRSALARAGGWQIGNGFPTAGNPKSLVLLVSFADLDFSMPASAFEAMLNEEGYAEYGATGSARDYYSDNSNGQFKPQFVVVGPLKLPRAMSYYGENKGNNHNANAQQMVVDACMQADKEGLDFTQFDEDGDGVIDNIFIYYSGYNEAEGGGEETVWPHRGAVAGNYSFDGLKLEGYACSSELKGNTGNRMAAIGTLCHEFAHVLGLPDFYDTDGEANGETPGLYDYSLMSSGNYNNDSRTPPYLNVVERSLLGWLDPVELTGAGEYSLEAIHRNQGYYYTTDVEGEVFMLENRQAEKWDAPLDGHGLLIYQVDRSQRIVGGLTAESRWRLANNGVNQLEEHPCLRIRSANESAGYSGIGIFFPGITGNTAFTAGGSPSALPWSGLDLNRNLTDIRETGGMISFTYSGGANVPVEGVTLQPSEISLNLLDSVQLVAGISPSHALNKSCDWYSSNRNVVSVNERGVIRALAVGTAEITVITRDGGFQAKCTVQVTQDMAGNEHWRISQRDIWLSWEKGGQEVGRWTVKWKKTTASDYRSATAEATMFRIRDLEPATAYRIQLVAQQQDGTEAVVLEKEVTTPQITAPFAAIGGVKGSYVPGESLWLNLVNLQGALVEESWTIDGQEVSIDREIPLTAGTHEIRVTYKDKAGNEETIIRKIEVVK